MSKAIKYKQLVGGRWHFWGYIDGYFVSPITSNETKPVNCEFTGLCDKNGVDIYESDIIEDADSGSLWVVKFDDRGSFVASFAGDMDLSVMLDDYNFKVIGNLYKNPELLK